MRRQKGKGYTMIALLGDRLIDAKGGAPREGAAVLVEGDSIAGFAGAGELPDLEARGWQVLRFAGCTIMPGFVNCHCHLVMPGNGTPIEDALNVSDEHLLLRAARNAEKSLRSGVTTLVDLGGRNRVTFALREAIKAGTTPGPDLILSGRAITITGGHCWLFNGEADSEVEITYLARRLLKEGADLIKMMGTGGGTFGTNPRLPQYTVEQLRAGAEEAHRCGRPAFVHCTASEAIRRSLEADVDVIVHGHFNTPENVLKFNPSVADRAAKTGRFWNPTLEVNRCLVRRLVATAQTEGERLTRDERAATYQKTQINFRRLLEAGVTIIAGSDEGWGYNAWGSFALELEAMVEAGMPNSAAILSATSVAARALGVHDRVGSLEPGKAANVLVLRGDPLLDAASFRQVEAVMLHGRLV